MPPRSTNDNYPAASLRHFHDAEILKAANSSENALCHYAFSVECAQKALLYWSNHQSHSGHRIEDDWPNVSPLLEAWASLDSSLYSALPNTPLPQKMYQDHPTRRYQKCFQITEQELTSCQKFAQEMESTIILMMIDGLITDQGGYVP